MSAYYDSSAFLKLVLDEPGAADARGVWDDHRVLSSVTVLAESRAALASARRSHRIDDRELRVALRGLDHRWAQVLGFDVTEGLARRGGELAERCGLRGYDSIHLATAEATLETGDVMVCSDRRLAHAAVSIGLEVIVPEDAA